MKKIKLYPYASMTLELFVVIGAVIGVFFTAGGGEFMGSGTTFLFFTIQSNLTIAAICLTYFVIKLVAVLKGQEIKLPQWLAVLKFLFTVAITLTFLVFLFMLMPPMITSGNAAYLASPSNVFCHNLVPIFALLDWFIFDSKESKYKKFDVFWGTAMPLYYFVFASLFSLTGLRYGMGNSTMPYFFLDYENNTWFSIGNGKFGVFYWVIIIVLLVLGISYVLMKGAEKIAKKYYGA